MGVSSGARSSPGGVGAECSPSLTPERKPGAKRDVCDPHRGAQAEPGPGALAALPRPTTWVPGAQVSSLMVLGGISAFPGLAPRAPAPRPAPPELSCCPRRPSYFPPGAQDPGSAPPGDPCPPPSCAGPYVTLFASSA